MTFGVRPILAANCALVLALASCGDDGGATAGPTSATTSGDMCPVGGLECPCTNGGACDAGLMCVEGLCQPEEGGSTASETGGSSPTTTAPGTTSESETTSGTTDDGGSETGVDTTGDDTGEEQRTKEAIPGVYVGRSGFFDVELDHERALAFLSYGGDGVVEAVDLTDGTITEITTGHRSEWLHFDPIRDEVAVSLPVQEHSSYWWDEEQEGYVAAIDATTLAAPTPIWIPLDPWQIVADGTGRLYAGGGSGQWTSAVAVDTETAWFEVKGGLIRERTNIQLHPARDRVYGADNGLSPSDIERWNLVGGTVEYAYDSPYHGDYPMCGDLRLKPDGVTIYTRCGHIFLASNTQMNDMTWVADLGQTWLDLAFHPTEERAFVLLEGSPSLYVYDTADLSPAGTLPLPNNETIRVLTGNTYLLLVRNVLGPNPVVELEVVAYDDL